MGTAGAAAACPADSRRPAGSRPRWATGTPTAPDPGGRPGPRRLPAPVGDRDPGGPRGRWPGGFPRLWPGGPVARRLPWSGSRGSRGGCPGGRLLPGTAGKPPPPEAAVAPRPWLPDAGGRRPGGPIAADAGGPVRGVPSVKDDPPRRGGGNPAGA
ncbi:hypothetical protein GCM10010273_64210 [Streptomyces lavendulocolor]